MVRLSISTVPEFRAQSLLEPGYTQANRLGYPYKPLPGSTSVLSPRPLFTLPRFTTTLPPSPDPECIQLDGVDSISFGAGLGDKIWKPDLHYRESVGVDKVARDGFWIAPSGRVWWARKIFLTLSCRMSFADMPYDTQRCPITLTGYQHSGAEIQLKIPHDVPEVTPAVTAPYFFNGPIRAACQTAGSLEWQMTNITGEISSSEMGDSVAPSTFINYDIHLTRSPDFIMHNVVFPTILVVSVAWTSFFIERSAVPARVAVVLIAYLTISGMTSTVSATLPRSPESAWIITVLWMSRVFVFLAILEYAIANFLKRSEGRITKATLAAKAALKHPKNNGEGNSFPSDLGKSARTDQVVVQVQGDDKALIQEVSKLVTRADRAFLITTTKTKAHRSIEDHDELKMCIRDQHVDVFCGPHENFELAPAPQS